MLSVGQRLLVDSLPEHLRPQLKERARQLQQADTEDFEGMNLVLQVLIRQAKSTLPCGCVFCGMVYVKIACSLMIAFLPTVSMFVRDLSCSFYGGYRGGDRLCTVHSQAVTLFFSSCPRQVVSIAVLTSSDLKAIENSISEYF